MRMHRLAAPLCLAGLISSTTGALAAPAEVLAAVNLRTGPGAQYYAIMVLPPGAPVEIYDCLADDSWCDVGYGETRGWIASRYLGTVRTWSTEQQIMRPPVFAPPPIYREPPVYTNPPPVYREPEWDEQYSTDVYIAPPPTYVYQPPVTVAPPVASGEVYPTRPMPEASPPVAAQPAMPPLVASTPPATARAVPTTPSLNATQPTITTPPTAAAPSAPPPATGQTVATSAAAPLATPAPAAPVVKPKYGSAVGKPGAPCKWVNGVCRND